MTDRVSAGRWPVPEPTPRRRLLDAFAANLEQVLVAAGYWTDVGQVVTLEPSQLDPEYVDDGVAVYIERQERSPEQATARTHRLTTVCVLVKRVAKSAAEARLDAVVDDIERALDGRPKTWPPGFTAPQYESMEPVRAPAGADWVGALCRYTSTIPKR